MQRKNFCLINRYKVLIVMMLIPVSYGEIIDKITILLIKKEKISDLEKIKKVENELIQLNTIVGRLNEEIEEIKDDLYKTNLVLWDVEDFLRNCEREGRFDQAFVEAARSVYRLNDRRFELKNSINQIVSSNIQEVKSYAKY